MDQDAVHIARSGILVGNAFGLTRTPSRIMAIYLDLKLRENSVGFHPHMTILLKSDQLLLQPLILHS